MKSYWLDEDGYPTGSCLGYLRACSADAAFAILQENWWPFDGTGISGDLSPAEREIIEGLSPQVDLRSRQYLRLVTGGWSGNEDMLEAVSQNGLVMLWWRLSVRGGLYVFENPGLTTKQ